MLMRTPVPKAERMRRKESKTTPLYLVRGRLGFRYCSLLLQRWLSSWNWIVTASTCIRGTQNRYKLLSVPLSRSRTNVYAAYAYVCISFARDSVETTRHASSSVSELIERACVGLAIAIKPLQISFSLFFLIPILIEKIEDENVKTRRRNCSI